MKKYFLILLSATFFFFSCKKKTDTPNTTPIPSTGTVSVNISNEVDGVVITNGSLNYTNSAGNKYSVTLLEYYISNVVLTKNDGTTISLGNYNLMNALDASRLKFSLSNVPNGTYTNMQFIVGVDFEHNHTGLQTGDLDPMYNMIWTWNTGYMFFKHEGLYKDSVGATQALIFHYGTDKALPIINLPINLTVNGNSKSVFLKFNLNNLYKSPNKIDFNQYNNQQSVNASDSIWIVKLKANFQNTFSFDHSE